MNRKNGLIFILWMLCSLTPSASAMLSVSARLEQPTVFVGQKTKLLVEVTVDAQPAPKPSLPRIEGLGYSEISGTNISQRWINGAFQMSQTYTYWLFSDRPGTYEIFPITVEKDAQTRTAGKLVFTVLKPDQTSTESHALPNYFFRAEVNRDTAYLNEPILLTFRQYSTLKPTRNIRLDLNPNIFQGFWHEMIENDRLSYRMETLGGKQYYVVDIQKVLLFPLILGEVVIEPVNLSSVLERPVQDQRSRQPTSIFNNIDSIFSRTESIRAEMRSNPVELKIRQLPTEGRPDSFTGAVGNFSLSSSVDKTSLEVGQALTLRVTVRGTGNLKSLPEPLLPDLEGFDRYETTKRENVGIDKESLSGNVVFEYLMVPKDEEIRSIPPVHYNFFNPNIGQYLAVETPPIRLQVQPSTQPSEETIVLGSGQRRRSIQVIGEDLRYIQTQNDLKRRTNGSNRIGLAQVAALHLAPLGGLGGFLVLLHREKKKKENPVWARRTQAPRFARKALRTCETHLQENSVEAFYATLQKALTRYFSDKWNVAIQGLTEEQRRQTIDASLSSPDLAQRVESLFRACDEARFAPGGVTEETMKTHLETAGEVFRQV